MRWLIVSPTRLPLLAGALLGLFALGASAGEIYSWKDAKGVTHYSDSPPAGQKHSTRTISDRGMAVTAAPVAKTSANSDCSNAHANVLLLQGTAKVGVDEDKDGKPDRELTATERATRLKLAQAQIETYCDAPAANAATTFRQG